MILLLSIYYYIYYVNILQIEKITVDMLNLLMIPRQTLWNL